MAIRARVDALAFTFSLGITAPLAESSVSVFQRDRKPGRPHQQRTLPVARAGDPHLREFNPLRWWWSRAESNRRLTLVHFNFCERFGSLRPSSLQADESPVVKVEGRPTHIVAQRTASRSSTRETDPRGQGLNPHRLTTVTRSVSAEPRCVRVKSLLTKALLAQAPCSGVKGSTPTDSTSWLHPL